MWPECCIYAQRTVYASTWHSRARPLKKWLTVSVKDFIQTQWKRVVLGVSPWQRGVKSCLKPWKGTLSPLLFWDKRGCSGKLQYSRRSKQEEEDISPEDSESWRQGRSPHHSFLKAIPNLRYWTWAALMVSFSLDWQLPHTSADPHWPCLMRCRWHSHWHPTKLMKAQKRSYISSISKQCWWGHLAQ